MVHKGGECCGGRPRVVGCRHHCKGWLMKVVVEWGGTHSWPVKGG